MTTIKVTVTPIRGGDKRALRKLKQLIRSVRNPSVANRAVSVWLQRWVNQNFVSQGGNVGRWVPFKLGGRFKPGTGLDRSAKLLQDTGRLRASFDGFYGRTFAGIGSDLDYSKVHELGLPRKNVPARRMLPLASDADVTRAIIKIYDVYIKKAIAK